jgi:hypothetical protein
MKNMKNIIYTNLILQMLFQTDKKYFFKRKLIRNQKKFFKS